jgi:hypothetical protein
MDQSGLGRTSANWGLVGYTSDYSTPCFGSGRDAGAETMKASARSWARLRDDPASAATARVTRPVARSSNVPKMPAVPPITFSKAGTILGLRLRVSPFALIANRRRI